MRPHLERCRRSADRGHPGGPVSHSAQRHVLDRRRVRACHAGLVHSDRPSRSRRNCPVSRRARGAEPRSGRHLSLARRAPGLRGDRRRLSGGDRRRGLLRRHGPFRAAADPRRLVRRGVAGAHAQLFRAGRADARRACLFRRCRQPVLRAGPDVGARPADRPRDRRNGDRVAVDHLRRLLPDPAGDQPRLSAPHERRPYRGPGDRTDLRAFRQLGARRRRPSPP